MTVGLGREVSGPSQDRVRPLTRFRIRDGSIFGRVYQGLGFAVAMHYETAVEKARGAAPEELSAVLRAVLRRWLGREAGPDRGTDTNEVTGRVWRGRSAEHGTPQVVEHQPWIVQESARREDDPVFRSDQDRPQPGPRLNSDHSVGVVTNQLHDLVFNC